MQCRRYGAVCPGYNRPWKFQDEGPRLHERVQKQRPAVRDHEDQTLPQTVHGRNSTRAHVFTTTTSIDERVHPPLIRQSFISQQPRVFKEFVCAAFPTMFFHNEFRFGDGFTFPDWVLRHFGSKSYYNASVTCLSAEYLGHLTKDPRFHQFSRQKYSQALRSIRSAIISDETSSDTLLIAIILLSFYEMNMRTTRDAWIYHSRAVKHLMLKRGAGSHLSGLGRVCHFAYRPFLIAAALYDGEPCFLDGDDWQTLADILRVEDSEKHSEWSFYINLYEAIFMELVQCPRHIQEAREINSMMPPRVAILARRIRMTCDRLRILSEELRSMLASANLRKQGIIVRSLVGPEPKAFPETSPSLLLGAAVDAISILEGLFTRLSTPSCVEEETPSSCETPSSISTQSVSTNTTEGGGPSLDFRFICDLGVGSKKDDPRSFTWLDRIAGSMGLSGAQVIYENVIEVR